ncbi:response regulator [Gracilibacillus marinus]|uniref:Response regulator n=1 Tax=Gracilibacillus marinus TaxID=630535 RepID=A0ABV8VQ90_9BACI
MKVCLFDDEPLAIELLKFQLLEFKEIEILFTSTEANINKYNGLLQQIDVVFLDIEMPGTNGLLLAEEITALNPNIQVVFVTGYNQYAVQAFEMNALDYILKPVSTERLQNTIQRLQISTDNPEKEQDLLHIQVLGDLTFQLHHQTHPIEIKWRTAKSKELFIYLLHNEGTVVSKDKLVDTLWEDIELEKAYSNLYVSIYNIRKALKELQQYIYIESVQDGYVLKLNQTIIDKINWKDKIQYIPTITTEFIGHLEDTMSIYKGNYLEKLDYTWLEAERFELEELWLHRAKQIATYYYDTNNTDKAIRWYTEIVNKRPEDEHASFQLMKLFNTLNYHMLVDHQYKYLKKILADLDITISPDITKWYHQQKKKKKVLNK